MICLRRTIAGFFLLLMMMPVCWFATLQIRRMIVQHEMLEKLERAQLETLSIPVKNLQWYKRNREIIVNNKLFDVKSIQIKNGIAEIKGLFDEKEQALKKALSASGDHQQTGKTAGKFISLVAVLRYYQIQSPDNRFLITSSFPDHLKSFYHAPFRERIIPPPRV